MFEAQQKRIALLVVFAIIGLLWVSTMSLAASPEEPAVPATAEPAPGFIEQQGAEWMRSEKRNATLTIVIGILVVVFLWRMIIHGIGRDAMGNTAAEISGQTGNGSKKSLDLLFVDHPPVDRP